METIGKVNKKTYCIVISEDVVYPVHGVEYRTIFLFTQNIDFAIALLNSKLATLEIEAIGLEPVEDLGMQKLSIKVDKNKISILKEKSIICESTFDKFTELLPIMIEFGEKLNEVLGCDFETYGRLNPIGKGFQKMKVQYTDGTCDVECQFGTKEEVQSFIDCKLKYHPEYLSMELID